MTNVELISLFSSIAALILAIVAIWLSIVFYRLSSALSAGTTEAAKGINASVEKLENLFDKLYTDTFSMVRETVSDMRKQLWPREPGADDKVAAEIEIITSNTTAEFQPVEICIAESFGDKFPDARFDPQVFYFRTIRLVAPENHRAGPR